MFLLAIVIYYCINYSNILLIYRIVNNIEVVTLSCAIRGFHVYRNIWQPKENETLQCYNESHHDYDLFAIKTCRDAEFQQQIMDHLPLEISRFTKLVLDREATVSATFSSTHYRRSPLVQGGLEIDRCKEKQRNFSKLSGNDSNPLHRTVI